MRAISLLFHDVYARDPAESGFKSAAAARYKLSVPGFDAQLAGVRRARRDRPILCDAIMRVAESTSPDAVPFLITVDDGGVSYYQCVAEQLARYGWRGHCFVSTNFIDDPGFLSRAQIRELDRHGHLVGSHSASHPTRFSTLSFDQMVSEWSRSRRVLEDILGHTVDVASVPGGYFSAVVARAAVEAGIRTLFTSEPVTAVDERNGCTLIGRFTIRRGDPNDTAQRLVSGTSWARAAAWASWNAKGLVKPLLGPSYARIADWLLAPGGPTTSRTS